MYKIEIQNTGLQNKILLYKRKGENEVGRKKEKERIK